MCSAGQAVGGLADVSVPAVGPARSDKAYRVPTGRASHSERPAEVRLQRPPVDAFEECEPRLDVRDAVGHMGLPPQRKIPGPRRPEDIAAEAARQNEPPRLLAIGDRARPVADKILTEVVRLQEDDRAWGGK